MAIHRPLVNIDRCLAKVSGLLFLVEIDRCLLKTDRSLIKVAGLINIPKNRSFDTNSTPIQVMHVMHWSLELNFMGLGNKNKE